MPLPEPLPLLLFAASALIAFMFGIVIAGCFPAAARPGALRRPLGAALLWASVGVALAFAVRAVLFATATLAWPYAVIAAGLAFLASPFALRLLPLGLVEGRRGLGTFVALFAAVAAAIEAVQ